MDYESDKDYHAARTVSLDTLRSYLDANGWTLVKTPRPDVDAYKRSSEEGRRGVILVPKVENERRIPAILDAARKLAEFEGRDYMAALYSLQTFFYDRVQCRLISPSSEDGALTLNVAVAFVRRLATLLSTSVKDVVCPEFVHKRISSTEITDLLNAAKFGQTERGSFVVNIYVPLQGDDSKGSSSLSFERRVFRRSLEHLMVSINRATSSIDSGDPDAFLRENASSEVVTSANLLEAIDNARVVDDSELDVSVSWSGRIPVDSSVPSSARVAKRHSSTLWNWAAQYRPKNEKKSMSEFIAKVTGVTVEDRDDADRPCGVATFCIINSDEPFDAQARLTTEQFRIATECLMTDRSVAFLGVCERSRSKSTISNISDLKVVIP